jgi:hypothetical protein
MIPLWPRRCKWTVFSGICPDVTLDAFGAYRPTSRHIFGVFVSLTIFIHKFLLKMTGIILVFLVFLFFPAPVIFNICLYVCIAVEPRAACPQAAGKLFKIILKFLLTACPPSAIMYLNKF